MKKILVGLALLAGVGTAAVAKADGFGGLNVLMCDGNGTIWHRVYRHMYYPWQSSQMALVSSTAYGSCSGDARVISSSWF